MDDRKAYLDDKAYGVVLDFLRGRRPDWEGRWLREIRCWDDAQLEDDHHYIQWLFPLTVESQVVFAPVIRAYEVEEARQDPKVHEELIKSLRRMLSFYGFDLVMDGDGISVHVSARNQNLKLHWITPDNHNYRRISRIIGSLVLFGLDLYAEAFLEALELLYRTPGGAAAIDRLAMYYWRRQASERPHRED